MNTAQPEKAVFRTIAFPLSSFDYLKDFQRAYMAKHGIHINNNQAIAIIFGEHQQMQRSEVHGNAGRQA